MSDVRVHGGCDTQGLALFDFSTNSNGCGPCPQLVQALQEVDATHYPDPTYTALRQSLADFHDVDADRIVLAGSASEFIFRITALAAQKGALKNSARVSLPIPAYGDYAHAAAAWGLSASPSPSQADLLWACEPSSPLGQADAQFVSQIEALHDGQILVLDGAYRPLRLDGELHVTPSQLDQTWQLWSPNKALGFTGIRAAYAVAPVGHPALVAQLNQLAPSWPVGSHGVALLATWVRPDVQSWLAACRVTLQQWKARQINICESLGWQVMPSVANFFVAHTHSTNTRGLLDNFRAHGIKLRDTTSFGLPGCVRLGVLAPVAQDALRAAWLTCKEFE
jgi:histidinol-phosphate aminotransferase